MATSNVARTAVDHVIDLATRMGLRPRPLASQRFAPRCEPAPIELSPREVLSLMQRQDVFRAPKPDATALLRHVLNVLRHEYGIFGDDFCEHCATFHRQPDGRFEHEPDCMIGVALGVVEA